MLNQESFAGLWTMTGGMRDRDVFTLRYAGRVEISAGFGIRYLFHGGMRGILDGIFWKDADLLSSQMLFLVA